MGDTEDEPSPLLIQAASCLKAFDDGQGEGSRPPPLECL